MAGFNKKIKILYTIPNFDTAGSGKVLYDLAKGINSTRFDVSIACDHDRGALFQNVKALGLPIYIIETTVSLRPYHSFFFRIQPFKKFIRTKQFDIVHSWHWSSDWTEALAVKSGGAKWLYTKKAMGFKSKHWKIKSYLADFIITINDEMQAYFPKKKMQALIPLGIDTDYYNPDLFNRDVVKDSNFRIITVANLVPVKGIEVLLKALSISNNKGITLTIVGDNSGSYGNILKKKIIDLKLDQQVIFLGKKADVRLFLAQSDLYVIPTLNEGRKEGMPMALVEAMCMAIPVLGSDISGIRYVLKDFDRLLFPASDSQALAKKIDYLYNLPIQERRNLGNRLREYCLCNFNMDKFINSHEILYENLYSKN